MGKVEVLVKGSGKHVHLSEQDFITCFGPNEELNVKTQMGAGQFVSDKKVKLIGPKGETTVSVIGPFRSETQIELSYTEARALGLRPPLRDSGDLEGTDPLTIVGPVGQVELEKGAMVCRRHIHMITADMEALGVKDKDFVWVKMPGDRELYYGQVIVRENSKGTRSVMHIDFDEMNAAGLTGEMMVEVFTNVEAH